MHDKCAFERHGANIAKLTAFKAHRRNTNRTAVIETN